MPALRIESNSLLLYDPDKSRTTVHCFIASPTPLEERMLGRLFFVVELNSTDALNHQIIKALQRDIESQYYQSEDFQIEAAFEKALQKVNERLQAMIGPQTAEWVKRANIVIGVIKDTALHFTVIGHVHAFLIHRQRIVDILESSSGAPETPSPLKIFSNIVSGHLSLNDSLLFCTTSLLDYLSQEKLKRVISENAPDRAIQTLEQLLGEAEGSVSFSAVVIKLATVPEQGEERPAVTVPVRESKDISHPQRSMQELIRREQKTNELLTHPLWPNIGRIVKTGVQQFGSAVGTAVQRKEQHEVPEPAQDQPEGYAESVGLETEAEDGYDLPIPQHEAKSGSGIGKNIAKGGHLVIAGLSGFAGVAVRSLRSFRKPKMSGSFRDMPRSANRSLAHGARWMQTMTPGRRRLFLVALILILLFAQSVVNVGKNRQKRETFASYQQLINDAKDQITAADAALLIKNESGARTALQTASNDLTKIPSNQKSYQDQATPLKTNIESRLQQIRHVVTVQPETFFDLATVDVGFQPVSFTIAENAMFAFNGRTGSLYRIASDTKTADDVVDSPALEHTLQYFVSGASAATIMQAGGSMQQYNSKDKKLVPITVQYPTPPSSITDAAFYNKRLYTLDVANNQIYRHDLTGTNYGVGKSWLTTAVDLHNARSLAIDGTIYIVDSTGKIARFTNGKPDSASFDAADPSLTDPKAVYTTTDLTTLFVLDPANHRVLEYDKKGAFLRQYSSDKLGDAKDFLVQNGTVYVLNGTQILTFPVTK